MLFITWLLCGQRLFIYKHVSTGKPFAQLRTLYRAVRLGLGKSSSTKVYFNKAGVKKFQGNGRLLKATQVYPKEFGKSVSRSICYVRFFTVVPPSFL